MNVAVHTDSKTRFSDHDRERAARDAARACCASGTDRLLPIVWQGRVIGWCGWSVRAQCAIAFKHRVWMDEWVDRNGLLLGYTSVDDIINNITNNGQMRQLWWFKASLGLTPDSVTWHHLFGLAGWPTPGVFNGTAGTARPHSDTEIGAIMHGGNVSPKTKHLLSGHVRTQDVAAATPDVFVLYDLALSYDQNVVTSGLVTLTNTLPPTRYVGAGDPGLQIMGCAISLPTGNTAFSAIKYTSIGGTGGQQVPTTLSTPPTAAASTTSIASTCLAYVASNTRGILCAPLVTGDGGVKQIDSVTMAATTAESYNLILGFLLAWMPARSTDALHAYDFVRSIPSLPRIRDGACLTFAKASSNTAVWQADLTVGWA